MRLSLEAEDYRLTLDPERGGSVAAFTWCDRALYRATCGPSITDVACFPLVPFSNRIANGMFSHRNGMTRLSPNFPGGDHPHTLHGFGWLTAWEVVDAGADHATLRHNYDAGEWPWRYDAEQRLRLTRDGLTHALVLRNLSETPMPAGLGFHPYFPCNGQTIYRGLHRGEWRTSPDGLPLSIDRIAEPVDWWDGQPVQHRNVDTVYTDRRGHLEIVWPDRGLTVRLSPSGTLPCTLVYTPTDADYFCVEPVSHETNAINSPDGSEPMRWINPGERFECEMHVYALRIPKSTHDLR